MRAALLPALLVSMVPLAPATAQTSQRFDVEWIAPSTAVPGAPFQVKKYQLITQAVLRPAKLYELTADWTADGRPVLASGTQLVGARAAFPVACTYRSIQRMTVIGGQSIGYHGCLVDRNADGRFEAMFMFPRPAGGMVLGGGYVPAQTRPVDVAYREAAPEAFTGKPNLHIQYDGCELGGRCSLTAFVGERNAYGGYLGEVTFKAEDFGKPLDLAGARIIVSGKKGGWITVQIVSPIPEGKVDLRGLR